MTMEQIKQKIITICKKENRIQHMYLMPIMSTTGARTAKELSIVVDSKGKLIGLDIYDLEDSLSNALNKTVQIYDITEINLSPELALAYKNSTLLY